MQQHPDDLLAAFTLDAVTEDERDLVLAHLVDCARCRQEVVLYRATTEVLPLSISDAPAPSAQLRDRILREVALTDQVRAPIQFSRPAVAARAQTARRSWPTAWLTAAALFLAALGLGARDLTLSQENDSLSRQAAVHGALVATTDAPGAGGSFSIVRDRDSVVTVANLPPPKPGEVYEAWVINQDGPQAAGTFVTTSDGRGTVTLTRPPAAGDVLAITNEPTPGGPAPKGKVLLKGTVT